MKERKGAYSRTPLTGTLKGQGKTVRVIRGLSEWG